MTTGKYRELVTIHGKNVVLLHDEPPVRNAGVAEMSEIFRMLNIFIFFSFSIFSISLLSLACSGVCLWTGCSFYCDNNEIFYSAVHFACSLSSSSSPFLSSLFPAIAEVDFLGRDTKSKLKSCTGIFCFTFFSLNHL